MHEILLQQLIAFPTKAPSATTLWSNYPQRHHELTEEEAKYLAPILTESMDPVAVLLVETTGHHFTPMAMKEHLKRPFLYAFEKGIEIVYKTRVASDEPVEFNFDTLQHDADKPLPEFLQMNIAPLIPTVMFIFQETIDFAEQEATSAVGIEELFKSILTGAMFLGVEFGLRIDVDDREVVK